MMDVTHTQVPQTLSVVIAFPGVRVCHNIAQARVREWNESNCQMTRLRQANV